MSLKLTARRKATINHSSVLYLQLTSSGDLDGALGLAGAGAEGLDLLDNLEGRVVGNLAEDDVLTIEPRGHNGGDEELGAVALNMFR